MLIPLLSQPLEALVCVVGRYWEGEYAVTALYFCKQSRGKCWAYSPCRHFHWVLHFYEWTQHSLNYSSSKPLSHLSFFLLPCLWSSDPVTKSWQQSFSNLLSLSNPSIITLDLMTHHLGFWNFLLTHFIAFNLSFILYQTCYQMKNSKVSFVSYASFSVQKYPTVSITY